MRVQRILVVGALALVAALLFEISFRVYLFGLDSLTMEKLVSVNIGQAGVLRPSPYPEVIYELLPNLDTWFKGARLRTNSQGLADREYPRQKPNDDFRIVLLGSSFSMASGVALEDTWQEVLENQLNARASRRHYDVINFSVAGYDLRQQFATLKYRALAYDPDLILVDVTLNSTRGMRREEVFHQPFTPLPRFDPYRHSFVLERLSRVFIKLKSWIWPEREDLPPERESLPPSEASAAFERFLGEFRNLATDLHKPLCFVILQHDRSRVEETRALRSQVEQGGACVIDTSLAFQNEKYSDLTIFSYDEHPNSRAQQIFARTVFAFLVGQHLLGEAE